MPERTISLPPELDAWLQSKVDDGTYDSIDEALHYAMCLLRDSLVCEEDRVAALRAAIQVGIDDVEAGRVTRIESDEDLESFLARIRSGTVGKVTR